MHKICKEGSIFNIEPSLHILCDYQNICCFYFVNLYLKD